MSLWPKNRKKSKREPGVNPDPVHPLPSLTTWYALEVHLLGEQTLTFSFLDKKERDEARDITYQQMRASDLMSNAYKLEFVKIQDSIIRISQIKFVMSKEMER